MSAGWSQNTAKAAKVEEISRSRVSNRRVRSLPAVDRPVSGKRPGGHSTGWAEGADAGAPHRDEVRA
jgi:hypothetical protein